MIPSTALALLKAIEAKMPKQSGFRVSGYDYKPDKNGNLKMVKKPSRMSVSKRIAQSKSKKVRPTKRIKGMVNKP